MIEGVFMGPLPQAISARRQHVIAVCLAAGAIAAVFAAIAYFRGAAANKTSVSVAGLVTAFVVVCGAALSVLVRLLSDTAASFDNWIRRSSAGALLLTPAALVLTGTFSAYGWEFSDCGTLIAPYRQAGSNYADFRSACDAAADKRLTYVLILVAIGCVMAGGYGIWLRYRRQLGSQEKVLR
ncbi:hypothetical protein V6U77_27115 [Micromonospora sp. CPCC 205546]|uniref:hypothetical protein n=1 Tax=Micromonospora sp. CPCC 205546 TaxID=3122397 RepID=UPI002FEF9105